MKKYSVHPVYLLFGTLMLYWLTWAAVKTAIDPTYHVVGTRYIPRVLLWYACPFFWYVFLSTAFWVRIADDGTIKTISILKRTHIKASEITSIEQGSLLFTIHHTNGKTHFSSLINGISAIKSILVSANPGIIIEDEGVADEKRIKSTETSFRTTLIVILVAILAIGFAVYVELGYWARFFKEGN